MNGDDTRTILSIFLLFPFGIVVGIGVFFILLGVRYARLRQKLEASSASDSPDAAPPPIFSPPCRWLAIKSKSLLAVQAALDLSNPSPCTWLESGLENGQPRLFIAPPVEGWILVVGSELPDPSDDIDRCFCFLMGLSRKLGVVHFYQANRVVNHHAWAQIEEGKVIRAYAWAGETLWNQGKKTSAENELGLVCHSYGSSPSIFSSLLEGEGEATNTDKVLALAARWSLDPTAIPQKNWNQTRGLRGDIPHPRLH